MTDYHLAVKEVGQTAPTAAEMRSGALKRNISPTEIHILIAQQLIAPIVTFAKSYFADQTKQDLGTGMRGTFDDDPYSGFVYDNTATGTNAWVAESILKAATDYVLYGMPNGGRVANLLTFPTDASPALESIAAGVTTNTVYFLDTTLEKDYLTLSLNPDEYYLFPVQTDYFSTSDITVLRFINSLSIGIGTDLFMPLNPIRIGGSIPSGFDGTLYIFANSGSEIENVLRKNYVLVETKSMSSSSVSFGQNYSLKTGSIPVGNEKYFSTLSIQQ